MPWAADGKTFSERIWNDKNRLFTELQRELATNLIRGDAPDGLIKRFSERFGVSRSNAGRLIMTESAYFGNLAQHDAFKELGVEMYEIVKTDDGDTCKHCMEMAGRTFKMSEFDVGTTAPIFHPRCRCVHVPYFEDEPERKYKPGTDITGDYTEQELRKNFELFPEIAKKQGFDGLPTIVSPEELSKYIEENGTAELWRGDHADNAPRLAGYSEQFLNGFPPFWSPADNSLWGRGRYTSIHKDTATNYAKDDVFGSVSRMTLHKDAKIKELTETEALKLSAECSVKYVMDNRVNNFNAAQGYDAFCVVFKRDKYYIILNRTAVITDGKDWYEKPKRR